MYINCHNAIKKAIKLLFKYLVLSEKCEWGVPDLINLQLFELKKLSINLYLFRFIYLLINKTRILLLVQDKYIYLY